MFSYFFCTSFISLLVLAPPPPLPFPSLSSPSSPLLRLLLLLLLPQTPEPGLDASLDLFLSSPSHDALAGLRPWLLTQSEKIPGSRVLPGSFTSVLQSVGVPRSRSDGGTTMFLEQFVGELKESGTVQASIDEHGVTGKLEVAK